MFRWVTITFAIVMSFVMAAFATAATVTFSLVPKGADAGDEVIVAPGEEIEYELWGIITSDDETPDNDGLSFFSINIMTTLGIAQPPADELEPEIAEAFGFVQSLGRSYEDDVLEIGGGQNTFVSGEAVSGIAVDNLQLLAKGMLVTPDTEGSFSVTLDAAANVLEVGSDTSVRAAEVIETVGFDIRTDADAGEGADGNLVACPCGTGVCLPMAGMLFWLFFVRVARPLTRRH